MYVAQLTSLPGLKSAVITSHHTVALLVVGTASFSQLILHISNLILSNFKDCKLRTIKYVIKNIKKSYDRHFTLEDLLLTFERF